MSTKNMFNLYKGSDVDKGISKDTSNKNLNKKKSSNKKTLNIPKINTSEFQNGRYSKADMDKMLEEYVSLPKSKWLSLRTGQFIRYVREKDNRFVRGGFFSGYSSNKGEELITVSSSFSSSNQNYKMWTLSIASIKFLFVRFNEIPSSTEPTSSSTIIRQLRKEIEELKLQLKIANKK